MVKTESFVVLPSCGQLSLVPTLSCLNVCSLVWLTLILALINPQHCFHGSPTQLLCQPGHSSVYLSCQNRNTDNLLFWALSPSFFACCACQCKSWLCFEIRLFLSPKYEFHPQRKYSMIDNLSLSLHLSLSHSPTNVSLRVIWIMFIFTHDYLLTLMSFHSNYCSEIFYSTTEYICT